MVVAKEATIGSWIIYQREPFQIKRKENVAYGTHSHSKSKLFLQGLSGGGLREAVFAHQDKLEEVDIVRKTAQVIAKFADKVQIMDPVSYETFDAEIAPEILEQVNEGDDVIFINYNGIRVLDKKS